MKTKLEREKSTSSGCGGRAAEFGRVSQHHRLSKGKKYHNFCYQPRIFFKIAQQERKIYCAGNAVELA